MKKIIFSAMMALTFLSSNAQEKKEAITYPKTSKGNVVDTYFGNQVADPYRWLEDDKSPETEAWVKAQNVVTFGYLNAIPQREQLKNRISALWNYEKIGTPFFEDGVKYFYKNDGLQNQYVIYAQKGNDVPTVFLNPNIFSKDGTISLGEINFSKNGKLVAYSISTGGSDWRKVIIMNAETKTILEDTLLDVKFSGLSWKGNEGFYYSSYDKPKGSELSAKTDQHKLYYHKLGTAQKTDQLIFGGTPEQKRRYVGGSVTEDDKYLVISASESTSGNELYIQDLSNDKNPIVKMIDGFETDNNVMENIGSKLFISTNFKAPNQRVVTVDANNPKQENWVDFIPETENVLTPNTAGGYFFAHYMKDAVSQVKQYDYDGKIIREIELPGLGTANGFGGKKEDTTVYFSFTNYNTPESNYAFNPKTGKTSLYWSPKIDFNSNDFESKQVFYTSKDGTKVPMIITYKKGVKLDGKNPTMLYGYGGFNISITPSFSVAIAVWMENGGIYAVANMRGGGEYGRKWHDAGTQLHKQNVFDDFIAAAEYLIKENYTTSNYLAISGRSNGGLLVGACMTQRPELFKVAFPGVGVLDMLRYHTFTSGAGWAYDYGKSDDSKEMFNYLKAYSPVHNVKQGTKYPATMVTTGDHDDRVVPAHSFKFAAELQAKNDGTNPTLIRIETNAGHGAGTPVSKLIDANADMLSFAFYNMGVMLKAVGKK